MFSKLNSIIKHPFTTKIFDIVIGGFLVGAIVYFVVEQKEIKPKYAISNSEMIAETTSGAPRLKLLWDNEEVQNVYSLKIAIWNAGREYLDKSSISATDPIRVTYPPDVQILYADFIRTSRENLDLDASDLSSMGTKAIQIEIVGDEALEQKDGGVLKILYTGHDSDGFAVSGRIKGSKQGFKEVGWSSITREIPRSLILVLALLIPFTAFYILTAIGKVRDGGRKEIVSAISSIVFASLFMIMSLMILYSFVIWWLFRLPWVT